MATDGWYPPAIDDWAPDDGGSMTTTVDKGCLHTTESHPGTYRPGIGGRGTYFGHTSFPHFTADVQAGSFRCWQHISVRRAARALKNLPGGVETNRLGVVQIEVVGTALQPAWDPILVAGLAELLRWLEQETDIPRTSAVDWLPYPKSYGNSPVRMSGTAFTGYRGWLGHQHVAENDHGDPGAIGPLMPALLGRETAPVQPAPADPQPAGLLTDDETEAMLMRLDKIKVGSNDADLPGKPVKKAQSSLMVMGYLPWDAKKGGPSVDGIWGDGSAGAMKKAQQDAGLPETGRVDTPADWYLLNR